MRNMRKIFSAISALGLVTVAGTSTVACQNPINALITMNDQVKKDLELIDGDKKSKVDPILAVNSNVYDWNLAQVRTYNAGNYAGKDATALLASGDKAKTPDAYDFLKDVLKLTPTKTGNEPNKETDTFDNTAAANIVLAVTDIKPTLTLNQGKTNYNLTGGYVAVQWKDKANDYVPPVNTYGAVNKITIANKDDVIPSDVMGLTLALADFDATKAPFKNFLADDADKTAEISKDQDLFNFLESSTDNAKILTSIAKATGLKASIIVTNVKGEKDGKWDRTKGDRVIKVQLKLGEINLGTEVTITSA